MLVNVRSATLSLGRWLLPALVVPSALACSAPADPTANPERAFVETPGGRRISFAAAKPGESAAALSAVDQPFVIAKFDGPITPAARRALIAAGYREVTYLPYDALLLERPAGAPDHVVPGMVGVAPYMPADRISRELLPEAIAARVDQDRVPVMIHVMPGHDRAAIRAALMARGATVAGEGRAGAFTRLSAIFPQATVADDVRLLAERSEILFIERIHRIGLLNDRAVGTIQSGVQGHAAAQTPIWEHGIRGENQIVAVIDTGLDANSCYFGDLALPVTNTWSDTGGYGAMADPSHRKIVAYDFLYSCDQYPTGASCETPTTLTQWDTNNHGTHVTGCMVGDSDNNPENYASADGQAPAAKVVMQDAGYAVDECGDLPGIGCPVINLEPIFEQSFKQGARAHNNSYGDNENALAPAGSNYSGRSADVDHFMWEHKDFLIVYAAGNNATLGGGGVKDFSVISPSTNKDGLSVGSARTTTASTSDDNISGFSSRGWTADGRIKPDLMAPGCNASAGNDRNVGGTPNCGNNSGCGTSYASPTAVGAATLVRQYFMDGFYPSGAKNAADALTPTAALVKAMLLNSSVSMKGTDHSGGSISPIPSNEQGWGRIQLDQAVVFTGGARKLLVDDHRGTMAAGATTPVTYTLKGVTAGQPLKVTLAWTDYPGVPDSPPTGPETIDDASTWSAARLVNDLDLTVKGPSDTYLGNVFTDGASSTGGTADRRNNVEQVLIAAPAAGDYTITVTPFSIVQDGQDFALVVTGAWDGSTGGTTDGGGGSGGSSNDGGPAGTGGAAGTGGTAGSAGTGGTSGDDGGCNCNLASRKPISPNHLLVLGLPLLLPARRRLRRLSGKRGTK